MSKAVTKHNSKTLLDELNSLNAYKSIAMTADGLTVLNDILRATEINKDPFTNSGHTANILGKQSVGRYIFDKLHQAGIKLDDSPFTSKSPNRIDEISEELHITKGGLNK